MVCTGATARSYSTGTTTTRTTSRTTRIWVWADATRSSSQRHVHRFRPMEGDREGRRRQHVLRSVAVPLPLQQSGGRIDDVWLDGHERQLGEPLGPRCVWRPCMASAATPAGFGTPDLNLPNRYLEHYFIGNSKILQLHRLERGGPRTSQVLPPDERTAHLGTAGPARQSISQRRRRIRVRARRHDRGDLAGAHEQAWRAVYEHARWQPESEPRRLRQRRTRVVLERRPSASHRRVFTRLRAAGLDHWAGDDRWVSGTSSCTIRTSLSR